MGELRDMREGGVAKWGHARFRPAWPRPPTDVAPPTALLTIGGHGGNWEQLVGNGGYRRAMGGNRQALTKPRPPLFSPAHFP